MSCKVSSGGTNEATRDYLFDNMRAILIILVVWGHILSSMTKDSDYIKIIYFYLFSSICLHLPLYQDTFLKTLRKAAAKPLKQYWCLFLS